MDPSKGVDLTKKREEEALICPHCRQKLTAQELEKSRQEFLALKKEEELRIQFDDLFKDKLSEYDRKARILILIFSTLPFITLLTIYCWLLFQPADVFLKYFKYIFWGGNSLIIVGTILAIFFGFRMDKTKEQAFQKFKEGWPMDAYKW